MITNYFNKEWVWHVSIKDYRYCIYCIVAIAFTASVLMQEGKSAGLGAIGGMAESYWGKNKGRSMEGKLERFTLIGAIIFFVGAILLNMNF